MPKPTKPTLYDQLACYTKQAHKLAAMIATTPQTEFVKLCRLHDALEVVSCNLADTLAQMDLQGFLTVPPLPERQGPIVRRIGEYTTGGGRRISHRDMYGYEPDLPEGE